MKRCKNITCWTDYPFTELGDVAGQRASIRHVSVLCYDGDKYSTVQTPCGLVKSIKRGYLYSQKTRLDFAKTINCRKLERMITSKQKVMIT